MTLNYVMTPPRGHAVVSLDDERARPTGWRRASRRFLFSSSPPYQGGARGGRHVLPLTKGELEGVGTEPERLDRQLERVAATYLLGS